MKITKRRLQRIIKEELEKVLKEAEKGWAGGIGDIIRRGLEELIKIAQGLTQALKAACAQKDLILMAVNNPKMIKLIVSTANPAEAAAAITLAAQEAGIPVPGDATKALTMVITEMKKDTFFWDQLVKAMKDESVRKTVVATISAACPKPTTEPVP